jgi:hypothetical protein
MKHLYPLICGLLTALCVHGQDRLPEGLSHDSSIHEMRIRYTHHVYSANDSIIHHREIMTRLRLYDATAGELRRYRNSKAGFFVWTGVTVGSITTAIVEGNQGNRAAAWSFGGAAFIALMGRFATQMRAAEHFRKAIHVYNKRFIP